MFNDFLQIARNLVVGLHLAQLLHIEVLTMLLRTTNVNIPVEQSTHADLRSVSGYRGHV